MKRKDVIRLRRKLRHFWRAISWLAPRLGAVVGVIAIVWTAAAQLHGEEMLKPEVSAFYTINKVDATADNAHVALNGLTAPKGVQDSYLWALGWMEEFENSRGYGFEGSNNPFEKVDQIPGQLVFDNTTDSFDCWLQRGWHLPVNPAQQQSECIKQSELNRLLDANAVMFERYEHAILHTRFLGDPVPARYAPFLSRLQEIVITNLLFKTAAQPDAMLQQWMANIKFHRAALQDYTNSYSRMQLQHNYTLAQMALPSLLSFQPELARTYQPQLLEMLQGMMPGNMHPEHMMQADARLPANAQWQNYLELVQGLSPYAQNQFLQAQQEAARILSLPVAQFGPEFGAYGAEISSPISLSDWHSPIAAYHYRSIIADHLLPLWNAWYVSQAELEARNRLLGVYVQIMALGLKPEEVGAWVKSQKEPWVSPLDGNVFGYDETAQLLSFTNMQGQIIGLTLPNSSTSH